MFVISEMLQRKGHECVLVTCRNHNDRVPFSTRIMFNQTIYTNGMAKQLCCQKLNLHVDVWIDDDPSTICPSSKLSTTDEL